MYQMSFFQETTQVKNSSGIGTPIPVRFSADCNSRNGGRDRARTGDPLLAKQVLSQLSYTPTVGVTFILKHLPPLRELIPCGSPESHPRRKWRDSLSLRREQRTCTRPRIALRSAKIIRD